MFVEDSDLGGCHSRVLNREGPEGVQNIHFRTLNECPLVPLKLTKLPGRGSAGNRHCGARHGYFRFAPIAIVRRVASTSPKRTCWGEALTPEVSGTRLSSIQLVEQLFGIPKVDCIEPFREPAIDRGEEIAGLPTLALIAP